MKKSEKASYSYIKKQQYDELVNIRQYNLLDGYQILRVGEINPSTPKGGGGRKIPHATLKTKIWNFSTPIKHGKPILYFWTFLPEWGIFLPQ